MRSIKMKTTLAGPNGNMICDETHVVDDAFAESLVKGHYAEYTKAVVAAPEKAVTAPKEKAVVAPAEVPEKQVQAKPVAPAANTIGSVKAPTWSTPKA